VGLLVGTLMSWHSAPIGTDNLLFIHEISSTLGSK